MTDARRTDGRLSNGDALGGCSKRLSAVQLSCLKVIDDVWPETITPAEVATRVGVPTNTAVARVGALVRDPTPGMPPRTMRIVSGSG
jgi:hypothetical protein